jgi:MFS family permease
VTTTGTIPEASAPTAPRTDDTAPAHARAVLTIILVSYFLILLDNSVIFTGLPSIAASLQLDAAGLSWVQDAYTLVFGGLLLLGARLGDLLGRPRVFIAGLAVFVALVAASASVTDLTNRVPTALTWGSGLLAVALVVALAVIVPAERKHHA